MRYFLSRFSANDRMTVAPKGECSKSQRWQRGKCSVDFTLSSDTEFEAKFHLLLQYSSTALCWVWASSSTESWHPCWLAECTGWLDVSHSPTQTDRKSHQVMFHLGQRHRVGKEELLLNTQADIKHCKELQDKSCNQSLISSDRGYSPLSLLTRWDHWRPWLQTQR